VLRQVRGDGIDEHVDVEEDHLCGPVGRRGRLVCLDGPGVSAVRWQVQEAKQRFSEVLRAAESGEAQIVTRHGEEVAVVIDIAEYRQLRGESMSLMEYLRAEPHVDSDLDIQRRRDEPREIELGA
jgi:prevent-host-death family protein